MRVTSSERFQRPAQGFALIRPHIEGGVPTRNTTMSRKAEPIRRTHASSGSIHALGGRGRRPSRPFAASGEPGPLGHSFAKIALLPATAALPPVLHGNPDRAEIVPDNRVPGMTIQAKLRIGAPGDPFEQEADRVATQVVRQIHEPEHRASEREQAVPREEIEGKGHQDEIRPMSVNASSGVPARSSPPHLELSIHQSRGGGQPLPDPIRGTMERAFGADFSGVRIHADAGSDELARSIQAEAFTTGRDVYFRRGAYEPRSRGGQKLLAHELTHVVQQRPRDQKPLAQDEAIGTPGGKARLNVTPASVGQGVVQRSPILKISEKQSYDLGNKTPGSPKGWDGFVAYVVNEGNKNSDTVLYETLITSLKKITATVGHPDLRIIEDAVTMLKKAIEVRTISLGKPCSREDILPSPGKPAIAPPIASTATGYQVAGPKKPANTITMEDVVATTLGMKSGTTKYDPQAQKRKACWINELDGEKISLNTNNLQVYIHVTFFMAENERGTGVTKGNYAGKFARIHITAEVNTGDEKDNPRFYFMNSIWTPSSESPGYKSPLSKAAVTRIKAIGAELKSRISNRFL
jgi:Domain of unknown function (DUF4157)